MLRGMAKTSSHRLVFKKDRFLSLGDAVPCGTRDDGATVCWGRNELGQLGDGTTTNRLEAVPVKW